MLFQHRNLLLCWSIKFVLQLVKQSGHVFSLFFSLFCSAASDTEQDAAVKLDQERADIVAKYDKVFKKRQLFLVSK